MSKSHEWAYYTCSSLSPARLRLYGLRLLYASTSYYVTRKIRPVAPPLRTALGRFSTPICWTAGREQTSSDVFTETPRQPLPIAAISVARALLVSEKHVSEIRLTGCTPTNYCCANTQASAAAVNLPFFSCPFNRTETVIGPRYCSLHARSEQKLKTEILQQYA